MVSPSLVSWKALAKRCPIVEDPNRTGDVEVPMDRRHDIHPVPGNGRVLPGIVLFGFCIKSLLGQQAGCEGAMAGRLQGELSSVPAKVVPARVVSSML